MAPTIASPASASDAEGLASGMMQSEDSLADDDAPEENPTGYLWFAGGTGLKVTTDTADV